MRGILCFGDSITAGRGELPNIGWCGRLKQHIESQPYQAVYNLGIFGNTSKDLLQRFDMEAKARVQILRQVDQFLILIAIGTNDSKLSEQKIPLTTITHFKKNIKMLITKARSYKTKLAFIGLPPVDESKTNPYENSSFTNERVTKFNNIIRDLCQQHKINFLDINNLMLKISYKKLLDDGLHPNRKGYDSIFTPIKQFIEKNKLI